MDANFDTLMTQLKDYLDEMPVNFDSWDKMSRLSLLLYGHRTGMVARLISSEHLDQLTMYAKDEIDAVFRISQLMVATKSEQKVTED